MDCCESRAVRVFITSTGRPSRSINCLDSAAPVGAVLNTDGVILAHVQRGQSPRAVSATTPLREIISDEHNVQLHITLQDGDADRALFKSIHCSQRDRTESPPKRECPADRLDFMECT